MVSVEFVTPADVAVFAPGIGDEKAAAMIRSITARAVAIAPCIAGDGLSPDQAETVRAIILDAVTRWAETGSGEVTTQTAGPFTQRVEPRSDRRGAFLQSEFNDLQGVCAAIDGARDGAFSIMLGGGRLAAHAGEVARAREAVSYRDAVARGWVVEAWWLA